MTTNNYLIITYFLVIVPFDDSRILTRLECSRNPSFLSTEGSFVLTKPPALWSSMRTLKNSVLLLTGLSTFNHTLHNAKANVLLAYLVFPLESIRTTLFFSHTENIVSLAAWCQSKHHKLLILKLSCSQNHKNILI